MRDLAMFFVMLAYIPMALGNGFAAYLLWAWTGLISPVNYLFGFMQFFRYNFTFALIALGSLLLGRLQSKGVFKNNRIHILFCILLAQAFFSTIFGFGPNPNGVEIFIDIVKMMVFCLLMPYFVTGRGRMHALLIAIALGIGIHGVVEGLKVISSGGGHTVRGIPNTKMGDNNHLGVALVMIMPILLYLYQYSKNKLVSLGFLGGVILTVLAIIGTNSRGAFLAMSVVALWLIATGRRKFLSFSIVAVAAVVLLSLAPDSWFNRMDTINRADQDGSFLGRVGAWKTCAAIALQNPLLGGGLHSNQLSFVFERFKDAPSFVSVPSGYVPYYAAAAHSIYFEILGDMGFSGLIIFISIIGCTIHSRLQIKRIVSRLSTDFVWARDMGDLLAVAMIAYAIGGAGVSLAYFEPVYMIAMLMELLKQHVQEQLSTTAIAARSESP